MNAQRFLERREKLRPKLKERGIDALLVSHAANRYYLSGFELHDPQCNESAGYLLITQHEGGEQDYLLTDSRYLDAAKRLWPEDRIYIYAGSNKESTRSFINEKTKGTLGIEAKSMCVDSFRFFGAGIALEPVSGIVEELRLIKDADEITAMERSANVNHQVMRRAPEIIQPGMTEKDISWEIEKTFRDIGASELSFPSIVAMNNNAAMPHAIPGHEIITRDCLVLLDCGGRFDDYCSDQTRTFWVGEEPSERFTRTREQVQEAQKKAIDAIRPGMPICELYTIARASFARHGVENSFTHALGHGIGLETHEPPSLGPTASGELQAGMIITIEPGLYYPAWGGIRWEFMVLVTEDGAKVL